MLSMLGYVGFLFFLPNYAISIGLSAKQASIIGALMNLDQGLGRPIIGLISDRYGRINIKSEWRTQHLVSRMSIAPRLAPV